MVRLAPALDSALSPLPPAGAAPAIIPVAVPLAGPGRPPWGRLYAALRAAGLGSPVVESVVAIAREVAGRGGSAELTLGPARVCLYRADGPPALHAQVDSGV